MRKMWKTVPTFPLSPEYFRAHSATQTCSMDSISAWGCDFFLLDRLPINSTSTGKNTWLGVRILRSDLGNDILPLGQLWASHFTSLGLSFLFCMIYSLV